jgi:Tfp pilus assembly PilM family ATPase
MNGLLEESNKQLETDVELADPFSKIDTPVFLEEVLKDVGPEFSVAIGAALRLMQ